MLLQVIANTNSNMSECMII